jgi:Alpha/beta hydrolase domain
VEVGTWRWGAGLVAAFTILAGACSSNLGYEVGADVPVRTPAMPAIEGPITGPGARYADPLESNFPDRASVGANGYVSEEYFVSGTAAGEPYRVRVEVVRPGDTASQPFSGHAIVEAIHPQGIPFVWNFTREYLMSRGHAAVNVSVFPNTVDTLKGANEQRYADLRVAVDEANDNSNIAFDHASDIYAQVGMWLKSEQTPLPGVDWLHMTGHSMSVGPVWQYMDSHHGEYRLERGDPIYDGFFPETTRTASRMGPFPEVDVPTLLINSELEVEVVLVEEGIDYRRPDSDKPGEQFRLYEVAGMPHNLSWMHPLLLKSLDIAAKAAALCANPLNSFPYNPMVSMALDHLIRWVEDDKPPPRAKRIKLTGKPGERGAAIARDKHGNARGGVRSTTLDVPVATHQALNEPNSQDEDLTPGSCLVYGSQLDFSPETLQSLYRDQDGYIDRVNERLEELVDEGWYLEQFADELRDRAGNFDGFDR